MGAMNILGQALGGISGGRVLDVATGEGSFIRTLVENGVILIAAGGGGIPVYVEEDQTLEGIDGVIDKDLASSVLGRDIGAQVLIIMTGVDGVYRNFGKKNQNITW